MNRLIIPLALGVASLTLFGCQSVDSDGKKTKQKAEQLVSVVPTGPGETEGMAKMAAWKVKGEVLAKRAPDSAEVSYEIAQKSVDLWIRRKIAESRSLADRNFGTVNLGNSSVSGIEPQVEKFIEAADSNRNESAIGTAAALSVLQKLSALGKAKRAASVEGLQARLELLRWEDWDSIRG